MAISIKIIHRSTEIMAVLQDSKHSFMYAKQLISVCSLLQLLILFCLSVIYHLILSLFLIPLSYMTVSLSSYTVIIFCQNIMAHGGFFFFKHNFLGKAGFSVEILFYYRSEDRCKTGFGKVCVWFLILVFVSFKTNNSGLYVDTDTLFATVSHTIFEQDWLSSLCLEVWALQWCSLVSAVSSELKTFVCFCLL